MARVILSRLPDSWARYFAFILKIPPSVNGGDPNLWIYFVVRAIPLGWLVGCRDGTEQGGRVGVEKTVHTLGSRMETPTLNNRFFLTFVVLVFKYVCCF